MFTIVSDGEVGLVAIHNGVDIRTLSLQVVVLRTTFFQEDNRSRVGHGLSFRDEFDGTKVHRRRTIDAFRLVLVVVNRDVPIRHSVIDTVVAILKRLIVLRACLHSNHAEHDNQSECDFFHNL